MRTVDRPYLIQWTFLPNCKSLVARTGGYPDVRNPRPRPISWIVPQEVGGRRPRRPQPSAGFLTEGFGQKVQNTEGERMREFNLWKVFYMLTGFMYLFFFSWQGWGHPLSLWLRLRFFASGRTALRLSLRILHTLPGLLTSITEGLPGSCPGQILPREGRESHPQSSGISHHFQCACAPQFWQRPSLEFSKRPAE